MGYEVNQLKHSMTVYTFLLQKDKKVMIPITM